jgi:UDPglucose 6-dehydrogenase
VMGESCGVGIVVCGYVGPVTAACLANLGHRVVCVDKDEGKLAGLRAGRFPIYEPGVQEWFLDGGFAGNGCASRAIFRGP